MVTGRERTLLVAGALLAILMIALTLVLIHFIRPARSITIEIGGSPDQRITATFGVDGTTKTETVTTPFKRSFSASSLSYSIVRGHELDKPDLAVSVSVDGVPQGKCTTDAPGRGVAGAIRTPGLFNFVRGEYAMGTVN